MARTLLYCIWAGTDRSLIGHRSLLAERVPQTRIGEVVDVPRVVLGVAEENLAAAGVHDPASLFDHYLNLCPRQGSRTIRSEEAVLVGMAALRPHVERAQAVR